MIYEINFYKEKIENTFDSAIFKCYQLKNYKILHPIHQ